MLRPQVPVAPSKGLIVNIPTHPFASDSCSVQRSNIYEEQTQPFLASTAALIYQEFSICKPESWKIQAGVGEEVAPKKVKISVAQGSGATTIQ